MNPFQHDLQAGLVSKPFFDKVDKYWARRSRILIVLDGRLAVLPDVQPVIGQEFVYSHAFGIPRAILELKNFHAGFSSFVVTVATRDGDGSAKPGFDISGLRFTAELLSSYDQVWLFGIWPDNQKPDSLDPADDALIEQPMNNALANAELAALAQWMDGGGGVFATGDHHLLGASMCYRVPRVAAMRAWTIADHVTTKDMTTRHETTRPANFLQSMGVVEIDYPNEEDGVPQSIEWVPFGPPWPFSRPHPLLSHPTLGPINVLPDHMHEGKCFDFKDPAWFTVKRELSFDFGGYSNQHFPTVNGIRPLPTVVAWGETPPSPPLKYHAGPQYYHQFPMIAAYDGQAAGLGRVVVDSTWHHWFDLNLSGILERADNSGDRTAIDKILRYYVNVGIYLASPSWRLGMLLGWIKAEQFKYFGRQAIDPSASAAELGRQAWPHLQRVLGESVLSDLIQGLLADDRSWRALIELLSKDDKAKRFLAVEDVEHAVVGAIIHWAYSDADELRSQISKKAVIEDSPLLQELEKGSIVAARRAVPAALREHHAALREAANSVEQLVKPDR
jgi:hypothetical protein